MNQKNYQDLLLNQRIFEFGQAMSRFNRMPIFPITGLIVSTLIVMLQAMTSFNLIMHYHFTHFTSLGFALVLAYLLADFINGLAHMIIDNSTHYTSFMGPFIAAFHLHHQQLSYRDRNIFGIYFYESGTKFWLVIYLILLLGIQNYLHIPSNIDLCLVAIGVFSSFAEVSHFLCHNAQANNPITTFLQKYHILLSKEHHRHHHIEDNTHYAFLNGATDPIINLISKKYFRGYKNHADRHAAAYQGPQTANR